jgi:hypothetical protein
MMGTTGFEFLGDSQPVSDALVAVSRELATAMAKNGPFNSAHEGYAVILEELDELWEEVRKHRGERDVAAMRKECTQIAAMAIRFMLEVKR